MLDSFAWDLKHGARLLRRQPGFTAVVVTTLGIAIGAAVTVFSVVDAWLLKPLSFPRPDRLVVAFAARPERPAEPAVFLPYRDYLAWRDRNRSLQSIAAAIMHDVTLTTANDARSLLGLRVTPEFFGTLGVAPLAGRTTDGRDPNGPRAVVLGYGLWQRQFGGSPDAVGTTVTLSGEPYEIVGVMPRSFETRLLDMRFDFWTLLRPGEGAPRNYEPGGVGPVAVFGRLRDGVAVEEARTDLATIARDVESGYPRNFNGFVLNLTSLQGDNTRTVRATLLTVSAAVAALLLIAAMNVGTLLLGRGLMRGREAAVRAAMGSGRGRLVRQFMTESLLIAGLGGVAGLAAASVAIRLFVAWDPIGSLPATAIRLDLRALAAASVAMAAATVVCGLVPALRVSQADPANALRAGGERGASSAPAHRAQAVMLVGQMAACLVMLVATSLLARTFARLQSEPLGFEPLRLWVANVVLPNDPFDNGEKRNIFYTQLADRMRALPGVRDVAAGTSPPLSSGAPSTVNVGADDAVNAPRISTQDVSSEFFRVLGIAIVAGRPFDGRDNAAGARTAVLNERAARDLFGSVDAAVGRRVRLDREPWREVVGIVGGVRTATFNTLEWKNDPIVYRPAAQGFAAPPNPTVTSFGFTLHVRADRPIAIADVRGAAAAVSSRAAITELRGAPEAIAEATRQPSFRMTLLFWFAAVSLLIAAIGVYGVVSQAVAHRLREVAIRLALGEDPGAVVAAIARRAMTAGLAGAAIGAAAALLLGRTMAALLYGVEPNDALSFAAAAAVLLTVTALAALIPARRAAHVDPAAVLRGE